MCNTDKEFKLCSCNGEKLLDEQVGWILRHYNAKLPQKIIKGMISAPTPVLGIKKHIRTLIATQLNSRNCFDFVYNPQNGDHLSIKIQDGNRVTWVAYQFHSGQWIVNETDTMGVSRQLEFVGEGKLDKKLGELFQEEAKSMLTEADLKELDVYQSPTMLMLKKMKAAEDGTLGEMAKLDMEATIKEKLQELYKKIEQEKADENKSE